MSAMEQGSAPGWGSSGAERAGTGYAELNLVKLAKVVMAWTVFI